MADAQTAVIAALGTVTRAHGLLAAGPDTDHARDVLFTLEDDNQYARSVLAQARNQLDRALLTYDDRTRHRAEAAHRASGSKRTPAVTARTTNSPPLPAEDTPTAAPHPREAPLPAGASCTQTPTPRRSKR